MATLFCSNCKITVQNDEFMKEHYKSEFHRYNIKRHLVNLPSITLEQFEKKKTGKLFFPILFFVLTISTEVVESRRFEREAVLKCETCK